VLSNDADKGRQRERQGRQTDTDDRKKGKLNADKMTRKHDATCRQTKKEN